MATYANLINVWRDFHKLARKAKATSVKLQTMRYGMIYWLGDGKEGGALSKYAAFDLSRYIKDGIKASAFDGELYPLSQFWVDLKADPYRWGGKKNPHALYPQIGMATGAYRNAIKALDFGRGRWGVGIPAGAKTPQYADLEPKTGAGQIDDIYAYATMLEFGRMDAEHPQPPRPILATAFREWSLTRLPSVMRGFIQSFSREIEALEREWESVGERMDVMRFREPGDIADITYGGKTLADPASSFKAWDADRQARVDEIRATEERKGEFLQGETHPGWKSGYGPRALLQAREKPTFGPQTPIIETGETIEIKQVSRPPGVSPKKIQKLIDKHKATQDIIEVIDKGVRVVKHVNTRFALYYNEVDDKWQTYKQYLERAFNIHFPKYDPIDSDLTRQFRGPYRPKRPITQVGRTKVKHEWKKLTFK